MMSLAGIDRFQEDRCTRCGECLIRCQYIQIEAQESRQAFQDLIDGRPSRVISECVSCMACDELCPEGANPFSLIVKRQEESGESKRFEQYGSNMKHAYRMPSRIQKGTAPGPVIDLCTVSAMVPGLFQGALFEGASYLEGGDYFCGIGFYHVGLATPIAEKAASVVERVAQAGSEEVVCYHDDCYTFFSAIAPSLGIDVPFQPVSWPEFLYHRMVSLKDRIRFIGATVAYQRPCASRYTPEKDRYVDRIFDLVGVQKPVRKFEKQQSLCCGGAIVPRNWEAADRIKHQNLEDARSAGAQIMITLCPMCFANLKKRAPEHGLETMAISDLCRAAIGEIDIKPTN